MKKYDLPIGAMISLGHPSNKIYAVKSNDVSVCDV